MTESQTYLHVGTLGGAEDTNADLAGEGAMSNVLSELHAFKVDAVDALVGLLDGALDAVVDASDAEDTASGGGVLLGLTVEGGAAVEDDDVGDGVGLGNA